MDDLEFKRMRASARAKAKGRRAEYEADDFSSYAILKRLEGSTGTIDQLWIDYLRKEHGDMRTEHRKGQKRVYTKPITERTAGVTPDTADSVLQFECIQNFLSQHGVESTQRERALLGLKYQWGFTDAEIAHLYGITRQRVFQMLKEIEERIRILVEMTR